MLTSLEALNSTAESSDNDLEQVNIKGKDLSESWEPIEKKVEKRGAEAYWLVRDTMNMIVIQTELCSMALLFP